jgi:hypothetical protein
MSAGLGATIGRRAPSQDGAGSFDYRIDVEELAEPGKLADTYRIRLSNGYDSGDVNPILRGGNVQIH